MHIHKPIITSYNYQRMQQKTLSSTSSPKELRSCWNCAAITLTRVFSSGKQSRMWCISSWQVHSSHQMNQPNNKVHSTVNSVKHLSDKYCHKTVNKQQTQLYSVMMMMMIIIIIIINKVLFILTMSWITLHRHFPPTVNGKNNETKRSAAG